MPVSIHAPARGGDRCCVSLGILHRRFNPRPRARGRPVAFREVAPMEMFQSTPPREGATRLTLVRSRLQEFQSTPPREGATTPRDGSTYIAEFQSTPPREGATLLYHLGGMRGYVSIHAPARGGDHRLLLPKVSKHVSIHAPARGGDKDVALRWVVLGFQSTPPREGATKACRACPRRSPCFNPRPRARGRRSCLHPCRHGQQVSIHAPARGGDLGLLEDALIRL